MVNKKKALADRCDWFCWGISTDEILANYLLLMEKVNLDFPTYISTVDVNASMLISCKNFQLPYHEKIGV